MTGVDGRLDRLESLVSDLRETIQAQEERIEAQQERIETLEESDDSLDGTDGSLNRRDVLASGGLLGLLGLGAGAASASTASGQIGTENAPLESLHLEELYGSNGSIDVVDDIDLDGTLEIGSDITLSDGSVDVDELDVETLAVDSIDAASVDVSDLDASDVDVSGRIYSEIPAFQVAYSSHRDCSDDRLPFDIVNYDATGDWDSNNHVFVAPVDGVYRFSYGGIPQSSSGTTMRLYLRINGSFPTGNANHVQARGGAGGQYGYAANAHTFELQAGDEVDVRCTGAIYRHYTWFSGHLVSALR